MSVWESIASLARFTPTPHNTQPFRIRPRDDRSADLIALTARFLPREDHGNRYVVSSFGIFAAVLEEAAKHFGYALAVTPVAKLDADAIISHGPRVVLGTAMITSTCAPVEGGRLLELRRTSRVPYHDRVVDALEVDSLARIATLSGHRFIAHQDPTVVARLLHLNAEAIIDNLQLADESKEIRGWYRFGETPAYSDGLWQTPMNQSAWELWAAFAMPRVFSWPGLRQFAVRRYLRTQRGTRHIGLLCGPFERWPDLYMAGRTLLNVWLEMARHEIYMQPMGSMLTNPRYAAEIARRFAVDDCWLVFRFGYSNQPPPAPRLETILIHE